MLSPTYIAPGAIRDTTRIAAESIRPLRRAEYEQLVELGWFEDEAVELLHGLLVTMSPQSEPHARVILLLTAYLIRHLGDQVEVRPQLPLAVADDSEPEPDIAVVCRSDSKDRPTSALLVIEVAEQRSLARDRGIKAGLYAAAGVPAYWIVNLAAGVVEVYTGPGPDGGYGTMTEHRPGQRIELAGIPGAAGLSADTAAGLWVPVDAFLG